MKIIDPHLHLFNLSQGEYHWLKPDNPPFWPDKHKINKNFTEYDLDLSLNSSGNIELAGFVHIEAGFNNKQPWQEIDWLESSYNQPFRTIAGIDLSLEPTLFVDLVTQLIKRKSVVGVRDILDENTFETLSLPQVKKNLAILAKYALIFELQMSMSDVKATTLLLSLLKNLPTLTIIINHAGWPPKNNKNDTHSLHSKQQLSDWQHGLAAFSRLKQCSIKCSGFEMIDRSYDISFVDYIITQCIEKFGIDRVMLASNFPLCLLTKSYQNYWQTYLEDLTFSSSNLKQLCYLNASRIYQIPL